MTRTKNAYVDLIYLFAPIYLFHIVFILYYHQNYQLGWRVIPYHLFIINMLYFSIFLISFTLKTIFKNHHYLFNHVFICLIYIASLSIMMLSLLNLISMDFWGENINSPVFFYIVSDLTNIIDNLPVTNSVAYLCLSLFPLTWALLILHHYHSKTSSFQSLYNSLISGSRSTSSLKMALLWIGFLFLCLRFTSDAVQSGMAARSEPLCHIYLDKTRYLQVSTIDLDQISMEFKERERYPLDVSFDKKNVILIIVDALRPENMSLFGYHRQTTPFLDSLNNHNDLDVVTKAYANCGLSFCGILSILSSQHINELITHNYKIHDVFKDLSYRTHFILSGIHNGWYKTGQYFHYWKSIDEYFDGSSPSPFPPSDDRRIIQKLKQLPNSSGTPSFIYFHLMSAHLTGTKRDEYNIYQPSEGYSVLKPDRDAVINNYDNGILQSDAMIKEIFALLKSKSYLDDAIVVITADHAEELGERGRFGHGRHLYQENISIPLIIYDASDYSYPALEFATSVDIAPTIFTRLGLPTPSTWDGISLLESPPKERYSFLSQSNYDGVLYKQNQKHFKYIYNIQSGAEELFEIKSDPNEERNLIDAIDSQFVAYLRELTRIQFRY